MMEILHVSCSPRGRAAESYRLSRKIIDLLLRSEPAATVVDRVIGEGLMPHIDAGYALAQHSPMARVPHEAPSPDPKHSSGNWSVRTWWSSGRPCTT